MARRIENAGAVADTTATLKLIEPNFSRAKVTKLSEEVPRPTRHFLLNSTACPVSPVELAIQRANILGA